MLSVFKGRGSEDKVLGKIRDTGSPAEGESVGGLNGGLRNMMIRSLETENSQLSMDLGDYL